MLEVKLSDSTSAGIATIEGAAAQFVAAIAHEIEARAKDAIHPEYTDPAGIHHPSYAYDTGALKTSITAVTFIGSDYADNVAAAAELRPEATFADEISLSGPLEAAVQAPVDYAGYVELGTGMAAAQPFLTPAVESVIADADGIARRMFGL